jgi:glycerophosphoryl diester phosphodiesterase
MKEWLIAHRGARCDARENTVTAFEATKKYPIGWVELDIHVTNDGIVICHHDFDVNGLDIKTHDFKELKTSDSELTTFDEAIRAIGNLPLIVEIKPARRVAKHIVQCANKYPNWQFISFYNSALIELADLGVDKKRIYLAQHKHPINQLKKVINEGWGGIAINKNHLWPNLVLRARYNEVKIYTYTVNSKWHARLIRIVYPYVKICTDKPNKLSLLK